ncbi:hypothetical protein Tco_0791212 [Tanacetum coccineum]
MYYNLNQLQWELERDNFHGHVSKTCLVVLRTQFKEFFDSKEVTALDVPNKCWQKSFSNGAEWEPGAYKRLLLWYLEELDKLIDEIILKYGALWMKEKEVQAIKDIERRMQDNEMQKQESLVTDGAELEACLITEGATIKACLVINGAALEACLVNKGITVNDYTGVTESTGTESENSSSATPFSRSEDENGSSDKDSSRNDADADIGPSYDNRDKEEHDDVYYEQQRAFFASLINNLKCDVEKCNEVNHEAQQANALLTNELERNKEKEKHFAKDMTIESNTAKRLIF